MTKQEKLQEWLEHVITVYRPFPASLIAEKVIDYLNDNKEDKMAECPYSEICCEVDGEKCKSCLNNKKRSYYVPERPTLYNPNYLNYTWLEAPHGTMTVATKG